MKYPKIYSLSTVGILKHYIHDYLFHPLRTDFIGPNGVGKSIIADLLQLLFIYDTEIITFGTDGLQQDKRSIYTLPYKTKIAYCFLNVEVKKDEFFVIGITISNQKGKRIIPFIVTRQAELGLPKDQLTLSRTQILISEDILNDNIIEDLPSLTRKLLQSKDLFLNSFKNKEEVDSYYRFLYDKQILPINLSIEKNYIAFAKVIQSFSKAKTLDLSASHASKSLKEFLFEDSDVDILQDYINQQGALERILGEYNRLNKDIKALEQKQQKLLQLREEENIYRYEFKTYKQAELTEIYGELTKNKQIEAHGKDILQIEENKYETLHEKIKKIPHVEKLIADALERANNNYDRHVEYEIVSNKIEELGEQISELKVLLLPKIHDEWKRVLCKIDISILSITQIKQLIVFSEPYLKKYTTLSQIEEVRKLQNESIDELKEKLKKEKEHHQKLISLFQSHSNESLTHWFMRQNLYLSTEEQNALLYFASTSLTKPINPGNGSRIFDPQLLLEKFEPEFQEDKKGFWIRLGAISEYVAYSPDAVLFENQKNLERSVQNLIDKLNDEVNLIKRKLLELEKVKDAKEYDSSLLMQKYDISLIEYSNIEKLKEAVSCIIQLDEKVAFLLREKYLTKEKLGEIKKSIPLNIVAHEPLVVKLDLEKLRKRQFKRQKDFATYAGQKKGEIKAIENQRDLYNSQLVTSTEKVLQNQKEFDILYHDYYKEFNENILEFFPLIGSGALLKKKYEVGFDIYKSSYISTIYYFEETSNEKNISVNLELSNKTYSFRVLEEAMLGSRIKSTDEIASALHEANQNRLNMADNIRDNMIKVFDSTLSRYKKYKEQIQTINAFFKGRKISNRFYFKLSFTENKTLKIEFVEEMGTQIRTSAKQGELLFNQSVDEFIEDFFRKLAKIRDRVSIDKLLNPKTYFDLSVSLTDQYDNEIPGSSGETYSAIALLGIARLSVVQKEQRAGLRFIILEEIGSLDNTNFNTFPAIAKEFDYQILTMAPHPFSTGLSEEWYAHHLIKGKTDENINFHPSVSYFKTKEFSEDLQIYLNRLKQ